MPKMFYEKNLAELLGDMAGEIERDLQTAGDNGFQLPEKKFADAGFGKGYRILPQGLRDLWLLAAYYEDLRPPTRYLVLSRDGLKARIVENILLYYLAIFIKTASELKLSDLRVDRQWKLYRKEKD